MSAISTRSRSRPSGSGQVLAADALLLRAAEDEPMNLVLELAHVARPRVRLEDAQGVAVEAARLAAFPGFETAEEVLDQARDVGGAMP